MAVSLVPSVRYSNCRHFCPYLRPRCVWFSAVHARMHARTHARSYSWHARMHSQIGCIITFHPSARAVCILVPRSSYPWEFRKESADKSRGNSAQGPSFLPSLLRHRRVLFEHRRCEDTKKSNFVDYYLFVGLRIQYIFKIRSRLQEVRFSKFQEIFNELRFF